ncbi:MAG: FAD-dependent oxidoreductase [Microthrixaceae bacterium]|nr:FAD-dependent oxidoreductase [Microthrixaceae bacterium]
MQFLLEHVDDAAVISANAALAELIGRHGAHLSRDGGAVLPTFHPGEATGAMTRVRNPDGSPIDTTDVRQATYGEIEGRRLAEEAAGFLREHVRGFESSFLADTAVQLGVRDTSRGRGYTLTGDDVRSGARFADAVAACSWPQEYHTDGRSTRYEFLEPGLTYQVPFASLRPEGIANLLVVGRCISADHDALASVRVMAPCLAMGQAAGTAAAMVGRPGVATLDDLDVAELQAELVAGGARLE